MIQSRILFALFIGVISAVLNAASQEADQPGAKIEEVRRHSEAANSGLRVGDIVMYWSRGENHGEIRSPLDLSWVEAEQAPLGKVTLRGLRDKVRRVWKLRVEQWGLIAGPNLSGDLRVIYFDGRHLVGAGKIIEGATRWREGATTAQRLHLPLPALWFERQAADALASAGQWADADEAYQQAIAHSAGAGSQIASRLWREWARTYLQRSDWEHAEKCAREALTHSQASGATSLSIAASLNTLATVHYYHGQLDPAEENYRSALGMIQSLAPQSLDAGKVLVNLGNIASTRGDLNEAENFYHQAITILEKAHSEGQEMAGGLIGLSKVLSEEGDLAKAEPILQRSIAILQKLVPDGLEVAAGLNNLGLLAWQRGDMDQAERYLQRGLVLRKRAAPGSLWVAQSITNLGAVAQERGDLASAEKFHQEALAVKERLVPDSLSLGITLNDLGEIALNRGDLARAEHYHRQAFEIRQRLAPGSLDVAQSLQNLGNVAQNAGDITKAEEYYRQGLAIQERIAPGSGVHAELLAALATVSKKKGDLDAALIFFENALNVLEAQIARIGGVHETRSGFRAKHLNYYLDYVDLLMLKHQPELAFHVLERSRARSLLEMLSEAHADIHAGVDPTLLQRARSLQRMITVQTNRQIEMLVDKRPEATVGALRKELDELLGRYHELEAEIQLKSPGYAALTQPQPLTTKNVQSDLLDENTALLEYGLGEERSYIWVITHDQVTSHELAKRSEIEAAAQRVYEALTARNRNPKGETWSQRETRLAKSDAAYRSAASELSQMILGPIAEDIHKRRLLVVSDGALQYIPFALLPVPRSPDAAVPATLTVEHEVIHLPSASILAVLRQTATGRAASPKMVAVLADPVFSKEDSRVKALFRKQGKYGKSAPVAAILYANPLQHAVRDAGPSSESRAYLPRLPFTHREAEAIMRIIPPEQGMTALGFEASRAKAISFELAQYRVVHFATHGLLDNEHPELSGLVFSLFDKKGNRQDGFLEMQDIYNLRLPVDLVVLSACRTGLGKNIRGEGLVGLTRGFMHAGALGVIASLWNVDDAATSELMGRFYKAMFVDGLSPASALRRAQLQMSEQERWKNPYYWAGFVFQGDWHAAVQMSRPRKQHGS